MMSIDVAGPVFLACGVLACSCAQIGGWQVGYHNRKTLGWSIAAIGMALYIGGAIALFTSHG